MTTRSTEDQLKAITPLCDTLFDLSAKFIATSGNFLPHGGSMDMFGRVSLCAAVPEQDETDATEVLPLLHDGLRVETAKAGTDAVAVSESVFIGPDQTPAIKVLVEHRGGLCIAMYQTWRKRLLRAPALGEVQVVEAAAEVGRWSSGLMPA
ncbi:MAG: hypothetical protein AAFO86_05095 [Pseudomonadota bacterium]